MTKQKALTTILVIALAGVLFSGYLSYKELFLGSCGVSVISCGASSNVSGIPACVIGFVMYTIVFFIAFLGRRSNE